MSKSENSHSQLRKLTNNEMEMVEKGEGSGQHPTVSFALYLKSDITTRKNSFINIDELERIHNLKPEMVEKIIDDALQNSAHLRNFEMTQLIGKINLLKRGQYFAFAAIFLILSFSSLAAWLNYPIIAGSLGTTTIIAVVGAYLYDRHGGAKSPEDNTPPKTIIVTPDSP